MAAEVVVTGVGMITPLGMTAKQTAAAWRGGVCAQRCRVTELADTAFSAEEVAAIAYPPLDTIRNPRLLKFTSTAGILGCIAAAEAAKDAGIAERFAPERIGLFAGAGLSTAGLDEVRPMIAKSLDEQGAFSSRLLGSRGLAASHPLLAFKILPNMAPCVVSMMENIKGPSLIFTPWENQTAAALVEAWYAVANGEVDCALAGGSDDATNPASLGYLRQSGRLGKGEYAGSAAAYVVLERASTAIESDHTYCRIAEMRVARTVTPGCDPLGERMGRTFAAAPAVLLALSCVDTHAAARIKVADNQEFYSVLERMS